jgi:hypothetical protein
VKSWDEIYADMEVDEQNPFEVACAAQVRRIYDLGKHQKPPVEKEMVAKWSRCVHAYNRLLGTQTPEVLAELTAALDEYIAALPKE